MIPTILLEKTSETTYLVSVNLPDNFYFDGILGMQIPPISTTNIFDTLSKNLAIIETTDGIHGISFTGKQLDALNELINKVEICGIIGAHYPKRIPNKERPVLFSLLVSSEQELDMINDLNSSLV